MKVANHSHDEKIIKMIRKRFPSKYTPGPRDEFEPGSRKWILRNKLGITSNSKMNDVEILAYREAAIRLSEKFSQDHSFNAKDIQNIHKAIFGNIYSWAGKYRNVELSKGEIVFARAKFIPDLMAKFSKELLEQNTPPKLKNKKALAMLLSKIHVEVILIHPFREGNGRTVRLLLHLIAQQAGYSGMNFSHINDKGKSFEAYIGAIHKGMRGDYCSMASIIEKAIV